jgi:hypothetical protein
VTTVLVLPILLLAVLVPLLGLALLVVAAAEPAPQRVARRPCDD